MYRIFLPLFLALFFIGIPLSAQEPDGYHSTKVQYFADYQWMEYLGNGEYMPIDRYLHEVTYSSPTLQEIYMNWGWGGNYDNVAYSPSGVWEAGGHNYSQDKKIIYNFAISQ